MTFTTTTATTTTSTTNHLRALFRGFLRFKVRNPQAFANGWRRNPQDKTIALAIRMCHPLLRGGEVFVLIINVTLGTARRLQAIGSETPVQTEFTIEMPEEYRRMGVNASQMEEALLLSFGPALTQLLLAQGGGVYGADNLEVLEVLSASVVLERIFNSDPAYRTTVTVTGTTTTTGTNTSTTTTTLTTTSTTIPPMLPAPPPDYANMAVSGAGVAIIVLICSCCALRWCRIKMRRPIDGHAALETFDTTATYIVVHPEKSKMGDNSTEDSMGGQKTRIIWDISMKKVNSMMRKSRSGRGAGIGFTPDASPVSAGMSEVLSPKAWTQGSDSPSAGEQSPQSPVAPLASSSQARPGLSEFVLEVPALPQCESQWRQVDSAAMLDLIDEWEPDGQAIEADAGARMAYNNQDIQYYSRSHNVWVCGRVEASLTRTPMPSMGHGVTFPKVAYTVTIRSGGKIQYRNDVALYLLRPALTNGEKVEYFSKKLGNAWVPARIVGEARSWRFPIEVYGEDGQTIGTADVNSNRLRRRFEKDDRVKVYRGPVAGWESAIVTEKLDEANTDLHTADLGPSADRALPSGFSLDASLCSDSDCELVEQPSVMAPQGDDAAADRPPAPWMAVPVRGLEEDLEVRGTRLVPSYLVLPEELI